jgi:hypothetical protein
MPWTVGLLDWFGTDKRAGNLVELALKLHRVLTPDHFKGLHHLISPLGPFPHGDAHSIMLILGTALAHAHLEPPSRQHVPGGQTLGQHKGIAIGHDQDASPQSDP